MSLDRAIGGGEQEGIVDMRHMRQLRRIDGSLPIGGITDDAEMICRAWVYSLEVAMRLAETEVGTMVFVGIEVGCTIGVAVAAGIGTAVGVALAVQEASRRISQAPAVMNLKVIARPHA